MTATAPTARTSVIDLVLGVLPNGVSVPSAGLQAVAVLFVVLVCVGLVMAVRLVLAGVLVARVRREARRRQQLLDEQLRVDVDATRRQLEARLVLAIRDADWARCPAPHVVHGAQGPVR